MKMKRVCNFRELLDTIRSQTAKFVGEEAATMISAAVTFEVL